jgi:hypothetical protein
MSKIIYVCLRDPTQVAATTIAVQAVADRLLPDNIARMPSRILSAGGIVTGISNPDDLIAARGTSLAAGYLVDPGTWEQPRTGRPDGAYGLFRSDDEVVEIVSDTVASRTVWYVLTDRMFVASTSQRAIVALLGTFEFNPAAVPWMLATGTLGPGLSWDKRISHVAGATTVTLDRRAWTVVEHTEPTQFVPGSASELEFERRATDVLTHVVGVARVADPRWAITLSGGVDSRVILALLEDTQGLRAVTWGVRASLNKPLNDANVARQLARKFGLEHQYFHTDLAAEPVDRVFERYVANGEGRVDHVSGYMDGFQLWSRLVASGIRGIVRGDQAFGHKPVRSPRDVRRRVGLLVWSDFGSLPRLEQFGLSPASLPEFLQRGTGESLETWRDRLQQQFRVPYVLAALSDLKLPYVEIIDPLLSGSVIALIRQLPDALRTRKELLRRLARQMSPEIPFATSVAIQARDDVLKSSSVVELLADSLSSQKVLSVIPAELAAYAIEGLAVKDSANSRVPLVRRLRRTAKAWAPSWAGRLPAQVTPTPMLDHNRIAFRAYLVERTTTLLQHDAALLS